MNEHETDLFRGNVERLVARAGPPPRLPDAERERILASLTRKESSMKRRLVLPLAAAAVVVAAGLAFLLSRGETDAATASKVLQRADAARATEPARALEDYLRVAGWTGDGAPTEAQRFKASLEAVKCEIAVGRAAEALARYESLYAAFPTAMTAPDAYKHTLSVFHRLMQERADPGLGVKLLELVELHHAERKTEFSSLVAQWPEMQEQSMRDRLGQMGYLGGE